MIQESCIFIGGYLRCAVLVFLYLITLLSFLMPLDPNVAAVTWLNIQISAIVYDRVGDSHASLCLQYLNFFYETLGTERYQILLYVVPLV